jgi:DNA-binding CsgD family transcriptional regulator
MFDLSHPSMSALFAQRPPAAPDAGATAGEGAYRGLERRSQASHATRLLALIFDEIDYGVLLVSADTGTLLHANHAARAEFDAGYPLQLFGRELQARHAADAAPLHDALAGARRGLRRLVTLGAEGQRVGVSVVPLGALGDTGPQATLLLLGKRQVCERLSVQWFARAHSLTPAETRVLEGLCEGDDPRDVAAKHRVGLATVRTQIGCIRAKTGTDSIRELVRRVAVLPPMMNALRAPV